MLVLVVVVEGGEREDNGERRITPLPSTPLHGKFQAPSLQGDAALPRAHLTCSIATPLHLLSPFPQHLHLPCPWLISSFSSGPISNWASSNTPYDSLPSRRSSSARPSPPYPVAALTVAFAMLHYNLLFVSQSERLSLGRKGTERPSPGQGIFEM